MNWYKNIKIRSKLFLGFGIVLVLFIFVTVTALFELTKIVDDYTYVLQYPVKRLNLAKDLNTYVADLRRATVSPGIYLQNADKIADYENQLNTASSNISQAVIKYTDLVNSDSQLDDAGKQSRLTNIQKLSQLSDQYLSNISKKVLECAKNGDINGIQNALAGGSSIINDISTAAQAIASSAEQLTNTYSNDTQQSSSQSKLFLSILAIASILLAIIMAYYISVFISKPIKELVGIAEEAVKGNLNLNFRNSTKDETGILTSSFAKVLDVFKSLISDLNAMSHDHDSGEIDSYLDPKKYAGEYGSVVIAINQMVSDHIRINKKAMATISTIVGGDFESDMDKLPGKKIFINEAINSLRISIKDINNEVDSMIQNSLNGNLSFRIDDKKYKGDWVKLMDGLNAVMKAVSEPTSEVQLVIESLSNGDFNQQMTGKYKGDFLAIKNSVNRSMADISSYIYEVSQVLGEIAKGDLTKSISRNYVGSFSEIKNSINTITESLNTTMTNIASASEQVLSGAKQISISSMDLAKGATIQASSVQELSASLDMINQQTRENAQNALTANELSAKSSDNAKQGNSEMKEMLTSMAGIKDASNNISKIIKSIDDIAFQTNLLALNAAVEAARAGEHGRGFAVVAEEVRNLAGKSQNAAKDTTNLIEESIKRVDGGTQTAQTTAISLDTIVENVREVSQIINDISKSSKDQANAIEQISIGLSQISQVIQSNSSTSEEAAAASQELSSQAEMLKQMVMFFKL